MNLSDGSRVDLDAEFVSATIELSDILTPTGDDSRGGVDLDLCHKRVTALGEIAARRGNAALAAACARFLENLPNLDHSQLVRTMVGHWVDMVLTYVANDEDPEMGRTLVEFMFAPSWPMPLTENDLGAYAAWVKPPAVFPPQDAMSAIEPFTAEESTSFEPPPPDAAPLSQDALSAMEQATLGLSALVEPPPSDDGAKGDFIPTSASLDLDVLLADAEQRADCALMEVILRLQANCDPTVGTDHGAAAVVVHSAAEIVGKMLIEEAAEGDRERLLELLSDPSLPEPLADADRELLAEILSISAAESPESQLIDAADERVSAISETQPNAEASNHAADKESVPGSLLRAIAAEIPAFDEALVEALQSAADETAEVYSRRGGLDHYREQLGRLKMTAETVGLLSLGRFVAELEQALAALNLGVVTPAHREALSPLAGRIGSYLATPNDLSVCQGLTDILASSALPSPLPAAHALALAQALAALVVADDSDALPERQREATGADVDLSIPGDLNPELLDGMLQELPVHCADFSGAIQRLVEGNGSLTDVDTAKRAAHTLKGAANTVGIRGIATLTHQLEDILVALTERQRLPRGRLATMLMRAADCLETMGEAVLGSGPTPDDALEVLQEVLDWANRFDLNEVSEEDQAAATPVREPAANASQHERGESPASSEAASTGLSAMRVQASAIEEMLRLVSESIISNSQVRDRLHGVESQMAQLREQLRLFVQLSGELEELVDLRAVVLPETGGSEHDDFDPLEFEHFSELHTVSRKLIEAATDARELRDGIDGSLQELDELIEVQDRLHRDNQDVVMRTRLVPVATIVSRLQRSVRQASRLLDKEVTLRVEGDRTLIDSTVLNNLADPLMHLLRNAVDHGVEAPEIRSQARKSAAGTITLNFAREGNFIVIRCQDDGGGLDLPRIHAAAVERELVSAGQTLTDDERARLILLPGFSTRTQATQMSGRGVGLDVVNTAVLAMKGSVGLHSEAGKGLQVELRLPAVLSSTHAFVIRIRESLAAVSGHGVEDLQYIMPEQLREVAGEVSCQLANAIYPLADLSVLLALPVDRRTITRSGFPVLLVRDDAGSRHAIRVQEILASRDFVLKSLGRYTPKVPGVIGMTIMGDGRVAPVIDLPELLRNRAALARGIKLSAPRSTDAVGERADSSTALVVDDSLSARRATAQVLKDAGYEVRTAIDGLEAAGILDKWIPTVIVTDLEMPRMNGLELISHVRARDTLKGVPIVMITSRSTEKHRRQAEMVGVNAYLTKPFSDDQLLGDIRRLTATYA